MTFPETLQRRWPWFAAGGAVLLIAVGLLVASLNGAFDSTSEEPPPIHTSAQTVEPPEPTPDEAEPVAAPVIDIAETQQMPYSPVWNPPDGGEYFWQIVDPEHGYPADGGTDYILAHACENQECAGDELRKLDEGDTLTYLGENYEVQSKSEIMKVDIADQDIWTHDPTRIVIITCVIETTWEQSDKNDIIIATKIES